MKNLDHEERIATGLHVHQLREVGGLLRVAATRVCDMVSQVLGRQRSQLDIMYCCGCPDRLQLAHERMHWGDLVVAEGTDEQKIAEIRAAQQVFQKVERRRVEPLQVIKEKRQWM